MKELLIVLLDIAIGVALYFIPAIVASKRDHQNATAIGILNLLLGWTIIGWVGALVWAVSGPRGGDLVVCSECKEMIVRGAKVCKHCGARFDEVEAEA